MDPVITGALVWFLQRVLDKGFDRLVDSAFDRFDSSGKPDPTPPAALPAMVAPRRHDLSVAGAQVTTDVDIAVGHRAGDTRVPVILTFQKPGTDAGAMVVPMVLGDTAHLTLRRDLYLITAMVVTHASTAGTKPTLHGIGWTQQWVADNDVHKLLITTRQPTTTMLDALGLQCQDGDYPFILAPTPTPTDPETSTRRAPGAGRLRALETARNAQELAREMDHSGWRAAQRTTSSARRPFSPMNCRASTSRDQQCPSPAERNGLCSEHRHEINNGHAMYDYLTGALIRPV